MEEKKYRVIGVMSGTSLDGIDLAFIEFKKHTSWHFNIRYAETISYGAEWQHVLNGLVSHTAETLHQIDKSYTDYLAKTISDFIKKYNITDLDAVCSHGHTALHQPNRGMTYQIGNQPFLAKHLNCTVVCDFRVQDVKLGGQGAPLVPIGDALLFSEYDFCLNLGGFANISTQIDGERVAYDVCAVNLVLNHYAKKIGFNYDDGGRIASTGTVNKTLLIALNTLPFFTKSYPKSLGLEWVNQTIFPVMETYNLNIKDLLRTFTEHVAIQLASEVNKQKGASVLITGGGVFNTFLMECFQQKTKNKIVIPNSDLIAFKEALIFGFLGVLKLRGENNCLKSVTGASKNHSSGKIFQP